jgi:hypothetical protein
MGSAIAERARLQRSYRQHYDWAVVAVSACGFDIPLDVKSSALQRVRKSGKMHTVHLRRQPEHHAKHTIG